MDAWGFGGAGKLHFPKISPPEGTQKVETPNFSPALATELLRPLQPQMSAVLAGFPYLPAACVVVGYSPAVVRQLMTKLW